LNLGKASLLFEYNKLFGPEIRLFYAKASFVRSQIKLGRIFGIEIGLHYSWFLIAFLIIFSLASQFRSEHPEWGNPTTFALALLTGALFFLSLLLHELAHSLVARSRGIPVREITLFALGGVSQIEKNPASAKIEFWMALVGPLTSAGIGGVCLSLRALVGQPTSPTFTMFSWLGYINLALAFFNMTPGYPLDGGRILRAALWWRSGDVERSTRAAARTGQVVGGVFIAAGIVQFFGGAGFGGLWIAFIGWFLMQAAGESYLEAGLARVVYGVTVAEVMTRDVPALDANLDIQTFVEERVLRTADRCFVVLDSGGHLAGLVTPHEVKHLDRTRWPYTTVSDIMRPVDSLHTVQPETPLKDALETLSRKNLNQLPVVEDHHLVGLLTRARVLTYLHDRMTLGT
jgi:Zn-dependent protease/predicted transcriptional regulator